MIGNTNHCRVGLQAIVNREKWKLICFVYHTIWTDGYFLFFRILSTFFNILFPFVYYSKNGKLYECEFCKI